MDDKNNEKETKCSLSGGTVVAIMLCVISIIMFVTWIFIDIPTIDKQKARIEELEKKLNYKTTVEIGPLPCPFCGSELVETMHDHYNGYYIHCEECGGQTGFPYRPLNDDEVMEQFEQETEEE